MMHIQTDKSKLSNESKLKISLITRFEFCCCVFGVSLLVCCFSSTLAGAEVLSKQASSTDSRASGFAKDSEVVEAPSIAAMSDNLLKRKLWQSWIGIPEGEEDKGNRDELGRVIEQVRSVEFKPEKETFTPAVGVEPVPTAEPNGTPLTADAPQEVAEDESEFRLGPEPVSSETLHTLEELLQNPDRAVDSLELGDVLFLSGYTKEAAVFYQEALNRKGADGVWSARDRAWMLFQIGNCVRDDDASVAKQSYRRLITEYPDSPWTDLAKARDRLIDWCEEDKPWALVGDEVLKLRKAGVRKIPLDEGRAEAPPSNREAALSSENGA
jgi:hypothetical protein